MLLVGIEGEGVHHIGGIDEAVVVNVQGGTHGRGPFVKKRVSNGP
jgi:hypothetical protein